MNSNSSRNYGPSEVRDLSEPLGKTKAPRLRHLPMLLKEHYPPAPLTLTGLREFVAVGGTPSPIASSTSAGSQSATGVAVAERAGFSPARGSNPHLAMSRSSVGSAQTKANTHCAGATTVAARRSTRRVKRPVVSKRRDSSNYDNNDAR